MALQRLILLGQITELCAKDPSFVPEAIDSATDGVKVFAQNQQEHAAKMAAMLMDVLHSNEAGAIKLTWFTAKQIGEKIAPWYEGSSGWAVLTEKYGLTKPTPIS